MNPNILIREETSADIDAITEVTAAAFRTLEISDDTEHLMILRLREAGALTLSLVAELDGRLIGHVAFSPVGLSDETANWFGLGPVSVSPEHHRQGVGSALIREGLSRLKAMKASGCCVVGHPEYYGRFGFEHVDGLGVEDVPQEAFFALSFEGELPRGTVALHDAFFTAESD